MHYAKISSTEIVARNSSTVSSLVGVVATGTPPSIIRGGSALTDDKRRSSVLRCGNRLSLGASHFAGMLHTQQTASMHGQLEAILHSGLLEDMHEMHFHRTGCDRQRRGDFLVLQAA